MARKGWDLLSDAYRRRLTRGGITAESYSRGESLASARGHLSEDKERFYKQTDKFAKEFVDYTPDAGFAGKYGLTETSQVRRRIRDNVRSMGQGQGHEYMRQAREAARLYESGEIDMARSFWLQRPHNRPEYMYFYHGLFGF